MLAYQLSGPCLFINVAIVLTDVDIMRTVVNACPSIEELNLSHSGAGSALVLSHLHQLKFLKKLVVNGDEYDPDVFRKVNKIKLINKRRCIYKLDPIFLADIQELYTS